MKTYNDLINQGQQPYSEHRLHSYLGNEPCEIDDQIFDLIVKPYMLEVAPGLYKSAALVAGDSRAPGVTGHFHATYFSMFFTAGKYLGLRDNNKINELRQSIMNKLRWIKASEKLPPNNSDVIWRELPFKKVYQHFRGGFFLKRDGFPTKEYDKIEWLSENESDHENLLP